MHKLIAPALLASCLTAPLQAQIAGPRDYGPSFTASPFLPDSRLAGAGFGRQLAHQRNRIQDAREAGLISRREARRLDREVRLIASATRRYARDGLSQSEQRELENRSRVVDGALGTARVRR